MATLLLACPYASYEKIKTILAAAETEIISEDFGTDVTMKITLREALVDDTLAQCRDASRGQCKAIL